MFLDEQWEEFDVTPISKQAVYDHNLIKTLDHDFLAFTSHMLLLPRWSISASTRDQWTRPDLDWLLRVSEQRRAEWYVGRNTGWIHMP